MSDYMSENFVPVLDLPCGDRPKGASLDGGWQIEGKITKVRDWSAIDVTAYKGVTK